MTPEEFERERKKSASDLERVIEEARGAAEIRSAEAVLGPEGPATRVVADAGAVPAEPPPWNPPPPPDVGPVNASWPAAFASSSGFLAGLVERHGERGRAAQVKFNSDQVRFDNALLSWVAGHVQATHQHYDQVIASMQKRMDDIDTRHRELERELVRHVHEMARRIDVVLGEGEKGRVSHEAAIRSIRERLRALEERRS